MAARNGQSTENQTPTKKPAKNKEVQVASIQGLIGHMNRNLNEMMQRVPDKKPTNNKQKANTHAIRKRFEHNISVQTLPTKHALLLTERHD